VKLLTDLAKEEDKGKKFSWTDEAKKSFSKLNSLFTMALILEYFNCELLIIIKTNTINFLISIILS
jgi:hypothetical protein